MSLSKAKASTSIQGQTVQQSIDINGKKEPGFLHCPGRGMWSVIKESINPEADNKKVLT